MKRTQPHIVGAAAFKIHKIAYHLHDVGGIKYALYGLSVYLFHINKISKKK